MLLDSHVLLWLLDDSPLLGAQARAAIAGAAQVHFSAASVWELRIKEALGKVSLPDALTERLTASGLRELPVTAAHADALSRVSTPHRDPFDRLLLAQVTVERLRLCTADQLLLGSATAALDARL